MPDQATPEELSAALQKAEAERDAAVEKADRLEKKLAKQSKKDEPKLNKSELPPAVREALEKAEAEAESTRKRAEAAEKLAKAERDERVRREFIAKAEKDFPHLGKADELGPRLMRMSETLSDEDYQAHLTQLAAANEQIAKGALFEEFGASGDNLATNDLESLEKRAEEIRKSDSGLSEYEAMQRAMREDREAQARYLAAQR